MSARPDPVRDERRRRWAPMLVAARTNGDRLVALYNALFDLDDGARLLWGAQVDDATAARLREAALRALRTQDFDQVDAVTAEIRAAVAQAGAA